MDHNERGLDLEKDSGELRPLNGGGLHCQRVLRSDGLNVQIATLIWKETEYKLLQGKALGRRQWVYVKAW